MSTNMNRFQYFNVVEDRWKALEAHYIEGVGNIAHLSSRLGNRANIIGAINSIIDRPLGLPERNEDNRDLFERIDDLIEQGGATIDPETGRLIPAYSWDQIADQFDTDLQDLMNRIGIGNVREAYEDTVQNMLRRIDFLPDLLDATRDIDGELLTNTAIDDDERFLRSLMVLRNDGRVQSRGETIFDVIDGEIDLRVTHREATLTHGMSKWHMTQYDVLNPENDGSGGRPVIERPRLSDLSSERYRLRSKDVELVHDAARILGNEIITGLHTYTSTDMHGTPSNYTRYIEGAFVRFSTNLYNNGPGLRDVPFTFSASGSFGFYQDNTRIFAGGPSDSVTGSLALNPGWTPIDVILYVEEGQVELSFGSWPIGPIWNETTQRWDEGLVHQMMAHIGNGRRLMAIESGINVALDRIGIEINQAEEHDNIVTIREGSIITTAHNIRMFIGEEIYNQASQGLTTLESQLSLAPGSILLRTLNEQINPGSWDPDVDGPLPDLHLSARLLLQDGAISLNATRLTNLAGSLHVNDTDFTVDWNKITGSVVGQIIDPANQTHQESLGTMVLDGNAFSTAVTQRTIDLLEGTIDGFDSTFSHGIEGWLLEWMGHSFDASAQTVERVQAMFRFDPDSGDIRMGTILERFNNFAGSYDTLEAALDIGPSGVGIGATIRETIVNSGIQNMIGGTGNNGREPFLGWTIIGDVNPAPNAPDPIGSIQDRASMSGHVLWFRPRGSGISEFQIRRPLLHDLEPRSSTSVDGSISVIVKEYTFQLWVRTSVGVTNLRIGIPSIPGFSNGNILVERVGPEWQHVTHTFQYPLDRGLTEDERIFAIVNEFILSPNTDIFIHGLMFNTGAILPRWALSPADTAAQVNRTNLLGEQMNRQLDQVFESDYLTPADKQILRREFEVIHHEREDLRRQYMVMRDLEEQIHSDLEDEDRSISDSPRKNPMESKLKISNPILEQKDRNFSLNMSRDSREDEGDNDDSDWISSGAQGLEDVFIVSRDGEEEGHDELDRVHHISLEDGESYDETFFIRNNDALGLEQYRYETLWDSLDKYIGDAQDWVPHREVIEHEDGATETIDEMRWMYRMEYTSFDVDQEAIREVFNAYFDAKSQLAMALSDRLDRKIEHTRGEMADISSFLAESRTLWTGENIMNIVSGTELWSQTVNGQLTKNDLLGYLTEDVMREFWADVPYELRAQLSALDNDLRNFEVRTRNALTNTFRNAGGVNYLGNSVGWNEFLHWARNFTENTQILRVTGMSDTGRSTAIRIQGGNWAANTSTVRSIWQTVTTTPGQTYTVSYLSFRRRINNTADNAFAGVRIYDSNSTDVVGDNIVAHVASQENNQTTFDSWVENSFTFIAQGERTRFDLQAQHGADIAYTAVMMNVGDTAIPWTPKIGEVYHTNIVMDANGIEVRQDVGGNDPRTLVTQISPSRFAIMERRATGNTEVLSADGLSIRARNLRVRDGFWMRTQNTAGSISGGPNANVQGIMIAPANNGWSFTGHSTNVTAEPSGPTPFGFDTIMDEWLDWEGEIINDNET